MEVKRFDIVDCHNDGDHWSDMKQKPYGEYVRYRDVDPLLDNKQSDLEIVQKALTKTGFSLIADKEGFYLHSDDFHVCESDFDSPESLLTWAKKTVVSED